MSFNKDVKGTKKVKVTARKKEIPTLQNIPETTQKEIDSLLKKIEEKKKIEADIAKLSNTVFGYITKRQDEDGFKGVFSNSYKIKTKVNETTFVTKNVFKIDEKKIQDLKELLGEDFKNLITETFEVTMKKEVFEDKKLQKELMELLGNNFSKFFNSFSEYNVAEDYNSAIYAFAKNLEILLKIRELVIPSKPSFK